MSELNVLDLLKILSVVGIIVEGSETVTARGTAGGGIFAYGFISGGRRLLSNG